MTTAAKWLAVFIAAAAFAGLAQAQDSPNRKEMKRADLTGTKMEVILSTAEYKPGEIIPRHIHHGEEAFYVLEGATVEAPDGKQIELKTGSGSINLRDVPHAGFQGRRRQAVENRHRSHRRQGRAALRRPAEVDCRLSLIPAQAGIQQLAQRAGPRLRAAGQEISPRSG